DLVRRAQPLGELGDLVRVDPPLERAAEGDADRRRRCDSILARARENALSGCDRLLDRGIRVPLAEAFCRGDGETHLVEPGSAKPVVALLVEREPGIDGAIPTLDRIDDVFGPGHLGHPLGADEADRLYPRKACCGQPVHELGAPRRWQDVLLVLEAVAWPDLADHSHFG